MVAALTAGNFKVKAPAEGFGNISSFKVFASSIPVMLETAKVCEVAEAQPLTVAITV